MLPVVALVGRPNVGKSTLFNVLTRSRDALVADMPGVTRDRHYGVCRSGDRPFVVVDTGGLSGVEEAMDVLTAKQVRLAIEEANVLVFVVDARDGLLPQDYVILGELRRSGKPIIAAVNKTDGLDEQGVLAEFSAFGVGATLPLSAAHNRGTDELIRTVLPLLPADEEGSSEVAGEDGSIRVAIVGRPNAGKSTLINRLLGEERLIVSDVAGTTRDPIRVPLERDGKRYTLIDTAGIRRKARVEEAVEKFSVIKTLQSIAAAQVVVVMIDARENLADQDLTLIGYAMDEGRALVIAINKWDDLDSVPARRMPSCAGSPSGVRRLGQAGADLRVARFRPARIDDGGGACACRGDQGAGVLGPHQDAGKSLRKLPAAAGERPLRRNCASPIPAAPTRRRS